MILPVVFECPSNWLRIELNKRGVTILLVEQNARMALKNAHRGYVLETGAITFDGPADFLLNDERVKVAYLGM